MTKPILLLCGLIVFSSWSSWLSAQTETTVPKKSDGVLRVATFNVSLNRKQPGQLQQDLAGDDAQARSLATVIRAVQPDVILLNELDWQPQVDNAQTFAERYLADSSPDLLGQPAWELKYCYSAPVNTGVDSGLDINRNGKLNEPEDAWGYGAFPGQYGMAILSRFPIATDQVRTFQLLRWSQMPGALVPRDPSSQKPYYSEEVWQQLRLSSKSHWDVPIETPLGTISILASHPTPPAFDGPADHNGCRNHDEVRLLADYINQDPNHYLVDDQGRRGGIAPDRAFVILGDLNSDPIDGDSRHAAIEGLLKSPKINTTQTPESTGGSVASQRQGQANHQQRGSAAQDTADFSDKSVGNLRVDYVLPSASLRIVASGVYWLSPDTGGIDANIVKRLMDASDHHLVWIDLAK